MKLILVAIGIDGLEVWENVSGTYTARWPLRDAANRLEQWCPTLAEAKRVASVTYRQIAARTGKIVPRRIMWKQAQAATA